MCVVNNNNEQEMRWVSDIHAMRKFYGIMFSSIQRAGGRITRNMGG